MLADLDRLVGMRGMQAQCLECTGGSRAHRPLRAKAPLGPGWLLARLLARLSACHPRRRMAKARPCPRANPSRAGA